MSRYAVVAHYSEEGFFSSNFIEMVNLFANILDHVCVVTTNDSLSSVTFSKRNVSLISRPNLGYDFYSYKVGLNHLQETGKYGDVLFVNSSFLVTNFHLFEDCVLMALNLLDDSDLIGITKSRQFSVHLQSYFFIIKESVISKDWFMEWFSRIEPKNSKLEVIFSYEIGLTSLFNLNGGKVTSLYQPNRIRRIKSYYRYSERLIATKSFFYWFTHLHSIGKYNPVQIEAKALWDHYGFIKNELLGKNPLSIDTGFLGASKSLFSSDSPISHDDVIKWDSDSIVSIQNHFPSRAALIVILHIHYVESLDEIYMYLDNIPAPFDLWITTSIPSICEEIFSKFEFIAQGLRISVGPNVGRDVAPFLFILSALKNISYDVGLKLHTKRSEYSEKGSFWRKRILSGLLPSSLIIEKIIKKLTHSDAGIIGGAEEYITDPLHWGANHGLYSKLKSNLENLQNDELDLEFFAGTMFWFKPSVYASNPLIPFDGVFVENGDKDGTLAHAFERIFCKISRNADLRIYGSKNLSVDLSNLNLKNTIPVIQ